MTRFNPTEDNLIELAELFKNFSDSTRIRILNELSGGEMAAGEISEALNMTQSAVSHQLQILKTSKLVKTRRNGKSILYSLADEHVEEILEIGLEHILED